MKQSKPNIVFILGDNVGWGDLGCYGGLAHTPRIDALAAEGLRFKNYNVEAQCAHVSDVRSSAEADLNRLYRAVAGRVRVPPGRVTHVDSSVSSTSCVPVADRLARGRI